MNILTVLNNFNPKGEYLCREVIKSGNINITYLVTYVDKEKTNKYILQKINRYVFNNPAHVMKNVIEVTNHIRHKLNNFGDKRQVLEFLPTKLGLSYYKDDDGEFWRLYKYIDNSVSYDNSDDMFIVEQAGAAFGKFQLMLNDFDSESLNETIKDFHNTEKRFNDLFISAEADIAGRKNSLQKELDYLSERQDTANFFCNLIKERKIPIRVTHNDTKCSNVLFDKDTNKALTVIDLDTVMAGLVAYDFGDGTRSMCSTFGEDETDYEKIDFDLIKYEAYAKGFLSKVSPTLTDIEGETLYMGPLVMTLELASRFAKDYLDGDLYFKCNSPLHNKIRCQNQIALCKKIESKLSKIKQITFKYL